MSLSNEDKKNKFNHTNVIALSANILKASPMYYFSISNIVSYLEANPYSTKKQKLSDAERDMLTTLESLIRIEFGEKAIYSIIDEKNPKTKELLKNEDRNLLLAGYILILFKDIINIKAHTVALEYLKEISESTNN